MMLCLYPSLTGLCVCSMCENGTFGVKIWSKYVDESLDCSNFHPRLNRRNERGNTESMRRLYADCTWSICDGYGECAWSICNIDARIGGIRNYLCTILHVVYTWYYIRDVHSMHMQSLCDWAITSLHPLSLLNITDCVVHYRRTSAVWVCTFSSCWSWWRPSWRQESSSSSTKIRSVSSISIFFF